MAHGSILPWALLIARIRSILTYRALDSSSSRILSHFSMILAWAGFGAWCTSFCFGPARPWPVRGESLGVQDGTLGVEVDNGPASSSSVEKGSAVSILGSFLRKAFRCFPNLGCVCTCVGRNF